MLERFELRVCLSLNLHVLTLKILVLLVEAFGLVVIVKVRRSSILISYLGKPKYSDCEKILLSGEPKHIVLRRSHTKLEKAFL